MRYVYPTRPQCSPWMVKQHLKYILWQQGMGLQTDGGTWCQKRVR
jgi:hypothetical protein